ncbi:ubiquitin-related domain-containing protein [Glomus cerebriforme]|uniref:Ubiquitin-related domain-containing protein n=1 Tax=Glomus cerebriforme TaxID=658196 RepID=A0A397TF14_9GLOM|nr:ubiquitin-related domain-containing protein [Glomus cerebriforme]
MSEQPNPTPPAGDEKKGDEHINLKVVGNDHNEVFFKIKRTTQLKKLMDAYCERQGKSLSSLRFLYDGERVQSHNTPQELEMEDGDAIDVMVEQIGGQINNM